MIYNAKGGIKAQDLKLAAVVMDASGSSERFLAMKQLLDIGKKKLQDASYVPAASEFTYASKGAVCILPSDPSMYEAYPLTFLFSQNATQQNLPASTTKTMTLITGLPCFGDLQEHITIQSSDVQTGSGNYFQAGDILTIQDLIYGMMLPSSNTCANAYAREAGKRMLGDPSASDASCSTEFIRQMNLKADSIGCKGSTFTSVSGLAYDNYSTASDLLRILIDAASFPDINRIWNKKEYTVNIGGPNARQQILQTTVTDETLEASYYIFGGKTGLLDGGSTAAALMIIAE